LKQERESVSERKRERERERERERCKSESVREFVCVARMRGRNVQWNRCLSVYLDIFVVSIQPM